MIPRVTVEKILDCVSCDENRQQVVASRETEDLLDTEISSL